jgi:5-(aminomethyl)-3-furanmethanol phosphate kinase
VQSILPESRIVRTRDELTSARSASVIPILCAHDFLESEEAVIRKQQNDSESFPALPHIWDVTSDSIAAWVALRLKADGLVLLKSCDSAGSALDSCAKDSVDAYFSNLAPLLPRLEWVNLRAPLEPAF